MHKVITIPEVAHRLGVPIPLVLKWINGHKLVIVQHGDGWGVKVSEVAHIEQTTTITERTQEALQQHQTLLDLITKCEELNGEGNLPTPEACKEHLNKVSKFLFSLCICGLVVPKETYEELQNVYTGKSGSMGTIAEHLRQLEPKFIADS